MSLGLGSALGTWRRLSFAGACAAAALPAASGCAPEGPRPLRAWTPSYEVRVTADPSPPRAREVTNYRVVVLDRASRRVIDRGEGRIFASSIDRANTYDSFEPAAEAGTYTARLNFITAGDWKVSIQFRRDSTATLERVDDWVQTVRGARPIAERPTQ